MLNSLYQWKYVILKPSDSCVNLSASSALMICIAFLDVNIVTDKICILPVLDKQNTILLTYKMSMYMFKSIITFTIDRGKGILVILKCLFISPRYITPFDKWVGITYIWYACFMSSAVISQFFIKSFDTYDTKVDVDRQTRC